MLTLYGSSISPFARKALVGLHEKGLAFEHAPVAPHDKSEAFRQASPFGRIPALRDGDFAFADSTAILTYLEALRPAPALYPAAARERARTVWFEEFADTMLAEPTGTYLFEAVLAPRVFGRATDEAVVRRCLEQDLPPLLDYLEREVAGRRFLVGDGFTAADLSVAAHLRSLALGGQAVDPARWPALAGWSEAVWARPSFKACAALVRQELAKS